MSSGKCCLKPGRYSANREIQDTVDLCPGRRVYSLNRMVEDHCFVLEEEECPEEEIRRGVLRKIAVGRADMASLNNILSTMFDTHFTSHLSYSALDLGQRRLLLDLSQFVLQVLATLKSSPALMIDREIYLDYRGLLSQISALLGCSTESFRSVLTELNGRALITVNIGELDRFFRQCWMGMQSSPTARDKHKECLCFVYRLLNTLSDSREEIARKANEVMAVMSNVIPFPALLTPTDQLIMGITLARTVRKVVLETRMMQKIRSVGLLLALVIRANRSMLLVLLSALAQSLLSAADLPESHTNVFRLLAVVARESLDLFGEDALMNWLKGVIDGLRLPPLLLSVFEEVDTSDEWFRTFAWELAESLFEREDEDPAAAHWRDKLVDLIIGIIE